MRNDGSHQRGLAGEKALDHDDFGLNQSKIIVIDSKSLERDAGGKPVSPFAQPALVAPS
jgi:hypothetical protein